MRHVWFAVALGAVASASFARAQATSAYLIRLTGAKAEAVRVPADEFPPGPAARGLLVWSDPAGDHWLSLTDKWKGKIADPARTPRTATADAVASRSTGGAVESDAGLAPLTATVSLPPANLTELVRGGELLTPVKDARVLTTSVVVRRAADKDKFPAVTGTLKERNGGERKVAFPAGVGQVTLADLTRGAEYKLSFPGQIGAEEVEFRVATADQRDRVLGPADRLADALGKDDPLVLTFTVETLLTAREAKTGRPLYLGDALDRLDGAAKLPPPLTALRNRLREQVREARGLAVPPRPADARDADPTGIAAVDDARAAIRGGAFDTARALLDKVPADDPRAERLTRLYRAVLLTEAGAASDDEAEGLFNVLTLDTPADAKADRFRVHANFARFLSRRAFDRLNDQAVRVAAGVTGALTGIVADASAAAEQYELAVGAATPAQASALAVDRARLSLLLADVIRTLDADREQQPLLAAAWRGATMAAPPADADPVDAGIAHELAAQLAFRRGDLPAAKALAVKSADAFAGAGFLVGAENAQRLLGQVARAAGDAAGAIRHLTASYLIAELLRERFADGTGRGGAGFLARRRFVPEALAELALDAKDWKRALEWAEAAKARGLTEALARAGIADRPTAPQPLAAALAAWPKTVAAVEYFFARDAVWALVVSTAGEVTGHRLTEPGTDRPLAPAALIRRVRAVQAGMVKYPERTAVRMLNDGTYDNRWQAVLHELATALLPPPVLDALRRADTAVVVPHHVLHYLPFAALVLEKDEAVPDTRMARPKRYLLDEPFVTATAPSLRWWAERRTAVPPKQRAASGVGIVQVPGEQRLDGVTADLQNLSDTFGVPAADLIREQQATAARTLGQLNRRGLLLVATHGENDADAPLDSRLLLYPDPDGDGRLTARQVYRQKVLADVVILNCCHTGLGDRSPLPGDDLFGLQRAFLQAGARSVVAGLWVIHDETAPQVMRGCLERLAEGKTSAAALADGQRRFLAACRADAGKGNYAHPYFWAVFSALGDDLARVRPE